jgi:hypothetical protein
MLKKVIEIIAVFVLAFNHASSQAPPIEWQKCYGGGGGQICYCIKPTTDGGSISCGTSRFGNVSGDISIVYGDNDAWIVKLDALGTIMWEKSIGGKSAYSVQQTADGGYIISGDRDTLVNSISNHDCWIAKLNGGGSIEWEKTYGGTAGDYAYSIAQTTDGGYIIAGQTLSSDGDISNYHGTGDCWIIKLDSEGNLVWQKALGGSLQDVAYDAKQTTDGGFIVSGSTSSIDGNVINPLHYSGAWLIKLDANGSIVWQKVYGSGSGYSICQTSDGGYAFTSNPFGNTNGVIGSHGLEDFWIVKLDAVGNLVWQKAVGGSFDERPRSIIQSADGGIVVAGRTSSINGDIVGNHGGLDFWIVKLSLSGDLQWAKALGGIGQDEGYSIYQTQDLGYIVAGTSTSNNSGDVGSNHGGNDFWIIKLSPDVLPITLVNFDAKMIGKDVRCEWKTSQEQNSSHFMVERSSDALYFAEMGRVNAAGNSALSIDYHFIDQNALQAGYDYLYYRLKMVDLDGSFKNSHVVKIRMTNFSSLNIYPNPAKNWLSINFVSQVVEKTQLVIYNDAGMKVYTQGIVIIKGNNSLELDIHSLLPAGYHLKFGDQIKFQGRFIKINND